MARRYRRPDLDSPFWWLRALFALAVYVLLLVVYALLLVAWLVWALIALPIAGVAKLRHNDDLAGRMVGSLAWKLGGGGRRLYAVVLGGAFRMTRLHAS